MTSPWHMYLGKHTRDKDTDFSFIRKALITVQMSHQLVIPQRPQEHWGAAQTSNHDVSKEQFTYRAASH